MLLLEPDARRRSELADALRAAGVTPTTAARIADVERWPVGELVIVDVAHFTSWWRTVGASAVVVQVTDPAEGEAVRAQGVTGWFLRSSDPGTAIANLLAASTTVAV